MYPIQCLIKQQGPKRKGTLAGKKTHICEDVKTGARFGISKRSPLEPNCLEGSIQFWTCAGWNYHPWRLPQCGMGFRRPYTDATSSFQVASQSQFLRANPFGHPNLTTIQGSKPYTRREHDFLVNLSTTPAIHRQGTHLSLTLLSILCLAGKNNLFCPIWPNRLSRLCVKLAGLLQRVGVRLVCFYFSFTLANRRSYFPASTETT